MYCARPRLAARLRLPPSPKLPRSDRIKEARKRAEALISAAKERSPSPHGPTGASPAFASPASRAPPPFGSSTPAPPSYPSPGGGYEYTSRYGGYPPAADAALLGQQQYYRPPAPGGFSVSLSTSSSPRDLFHGVGGAGVGGAGTPPASYYVPQYY